jgi:hypothetical protein
MEITVIVYRRYISVVLLPDLSMTNGETLHQRQSKSCLIFYLSRRLENIYL